jgi:hypothetical protein
LVDKLLEDCFAQAEQVEAESLLIAECSNGLPMVDSDLELIERIQVGVIKLSRGDLILLRKWIAQANEDWRDVLDSAGFYRDPKAHLSWKP